MGDPDENYISSFKRFLELFCRDVEEPSSEESESIVRHVSYMLEPSEIEGESLRWALDYLNQTHECPHGLGEQVAREAFRRALQHDLREFLNSTALSKDSQPDSQSSTLPRIEVRRLQREMEIQVYKVCAEWNRQLPALIHTPRPFLPVSVHAIKNTRRRMEDRHVILPDLNTLFQLQDRPRLSYFAVFDGHGGPDAAIFAASQLHVNMLRDPGFHSDPEAAHKRAYTTTDRQFLRKAAEMKLGCGTTGVSMLLRGEDCYVSWLGDSQIMLVREGQAVTLMEPHKPDREDEQKRIEELGGFVINCAGVWRVRGNISVSRAIGDAKEKPFLCSDADSCSFRRTGTEDYFVLACDGIWDVLDPAEVPFLVHAYLSQHPGHLRGVAPHLVARAKDLRSTDNISCIVVFLRRDVAPPVGVPPLQGFQPLLQQGGGGVGGGVGGGGVGGGGVGGLGGGGGEESGGSDISASQQGSLASLTSGSTTTGSSSSVLTINSAAWGGGGGGGGGGVEGEGSVDALYSPGRQIVSDLLPHKLERQTGFFFHPSLRSLRTGHRKQQLVPLQEGRVSRDPSASHDLLQLSVNSKEEKEGEHHPHPHPHPHSYPRPKPLSRASSRRGGGGGGGGGGGHGKRRSRQKRRKARLLLKSDSPDSSAVDSGGDLSLGGDDLSLSSSSCFGPPGSLETLAKHTSLAEILHQMGDPGDENTNPNTQQQQRQEILSVQGTPAPLHTTLPRISGPTTPSGFLNTTTSMTPVSTSRLPEPSRGVPQGKSKSRPFNL